MKVVPGKMAEATELNKKHYAAASRLGAPPMRSCRRLSGRGEFFHTLAGETEWDSFAAMEASFEKMFASPERQAMMAKYDALIVSHEIEFYLPMPQQHSLGRSILMSTGHPR